MSKRVLVPAAVIILAMVFFGVAKADSQIYISQWQTASSDSSSADFVELFNPNDAGFPLSGYVLVKRTKTTKKDMELYRWASGDSIPAHSFYLLANPALGAVSADVATTTISLSDDNGLAIRYGEPNSGATTTSVAWGAAANDFQNIIATSTTAKSYFKINLYADDNLYGSPAAGPRNSLVSYILPSGNPPLNASTTAEGAATGTKSDLIKISEILPNPAGDDSGNEAVELINNGSSDFDVAGWFLDDKTDSGIKSSAYQLPAPSVVPAGGFLVVVIPSGHFTLNNSGGDTANLYFFDQTLADSVSYSGTAGEGQGYQNVSGTWMWAPETLGLPNAAPPVQSSGNGGGGGATSLNYNSNAVTYQYNGSHATSVVISEFLVNPSGENSGKQWVELYNTTDATTSAVGWKLDDGGADNLPGGSAYTLPAAAIIGPRGFLQITVPAGKFLLNTAGDSLRLFRPDGSLAQSVTFKQAPEGQSYSAARDGSWTFGAPTPGEINAADQPLSQVYISELLPNPAGDDEEFVELFNPSTTTPVNLKNFKLLIGTREKVFDDFVLATGSYLTLYEDDLPVKLRDAGQTVTLEDNLGRPISIASYDKAQNGFAFAWAGDSYLWTQTPTPGQDNQLVLAAETVEPANLTPAPAKKSSAPAAVSLADIQMQKQLALLQQQVTELRQAPAAPASIQESSRTNPSASPAPSFDWTGALALVLSAVTLLLVVLKFFWPAVSGRK